MNVFFRHLNNLIRNTSEFSYYIIASATVAPPLLFMNYSFADSLDWGNGTSSIEGDYTAPPVNITPPNEGESRNYYTL